MMDYGPLSRIAACTMDVAACTVPVPRGCSRRRVVPWHGACSVRSERRTGPDTGPEPIVATGSADPKRQLPGSVAGAIGSGYRFLNNNKVRSCPMREPGKRIAS